MRRSFTHSVALCALSALAGCGDIATMLTPSGAGEARPARVSFTAAIAAGATQQATDVVALRVTSLYVKTGGARVPIGVQTLALSSATTQAVPVPVDLASCLADPARDGATVDAGCSVVLELALQVNGVVVDNQVVGPLRLAAGGNAAVSQPIELFEIASVEVTPASALSLNIGATAPLAAVVRDSRGRPVNARVVTFVSSSPTVATVDANGVVSAISAGQAVITASVGTISTQTTVSVSRAPVTLTIANVTGSGSGVLRSSPAGIDCRVVAGVLSGACSFAFPADAQVTLTSTADPRQIFSAWGGACTGNAIGGSCAVTLTQTQTVSAQFIALRRIAVAAAGTDGRGHITALGGLNCRVDGASVSGTCFVDIADGSSLTLTAVPDGATAGSVAQVFAPWGGACASSSGLTCVVNAAGSDASVPSGFFDGKSLDITVGGPGGGTVTNGSALSCVRGASATSGTCTETVMHGATVTLTAQGDAQSVFVGWSGACTGSGASCAVTMTQARAVSAQFAKRQVPLAITLDGSGAGSLSVNGIVACVRAPGSNAPTTCTKQIDVGSTVTVTPAAISPSTFAGYGGECTGTGVCIIAMQTARSVSANFSAPLPVSLTIDALAMGSGDVRSTEASPLIDCAVRGGVASGAKCTATVPIGTTITLRATGLANNALTFWGDACTGQSTYECTVVVNGPMRAAAGFTPAIDVDMRLAGAGQGSVTFQPSAAPSQAPCVMPAGGVAVNCRFSLPTGMTGIFRGVATSGSSFAGIVGPCVESVSASPVPVCTYRGIGFVRVFNATFTSP